MYQHAFGPPPAQVGERLIEAVPHIQRIESLHRRRLGQQIDVVGRTRVLAGEVTRDDTAQNNSRLGRKPAQHGIEDLTADVVVIDVDAFGAVLLELSTQIVLLVVDARVEPEVLHHRAAFLRATGDTDHPGAGDLGDLTCDRSSGTGCGGHHDGLTGLGAADLLHTEVCGGAAGTVDAHDRPLVTLPRDRRAEDVVPDDRVLLEPGEGGDDIADLVSGAT